MWTCFSDSHSGGFRKLEYDEIYIEGSKEHAIQIFKDRFDIDPEDRACECCCEDYFIWEHEDLTQITACHRNCSFNEDSQRYEEYSDHPQKSLIPLDDYLTEGNILLIANPTILPPKE